MPLQITLKTGTYTVPAGQLNKGMRAQATQTPVFTVDGVTGKHDLQFSGFAWGNYNATTHTDSVVIPKPSECLADVAWTVWAPDGTAYQGHAPNNAPGDVVDFSELGPVYGWVLTSTATAQAPKPLIVDASTTYLGGVVLDRNPASGHPMALTAASLDVATVGAVKGIPSLDTTGHIQDTELSPNVAMLNAQTNTFVGNLRALLQDKGGTDFNPKAYGAKGDGVTDDTAAIAATITAAGVVGGRVQLPHGAFVLKPTTTTPITLPSNVEICGVGPGTQLIVPPGNGDWQDLFYAATASNIWIHDLRINGNAANNATNTIAVGNVLTKQHAINIGSAGSSSNILIERVSFDTCSGVNTVLIQNASNVAIIDCFANFYMPATNPDYDNSAFYVDGSNVIIAHNRGAVANSPAITPLRGARALIEFHAEGTVIGNRATNFQTVVNQTHQTGVSSNGSTVALNSAINANYGIRLSAIAPYTSSNVTCANNTIHLNQTAWGFNTCFGIAINSDPTLNGSLRNVTVAGNIVQHVDAPANANMVYGNTAGIMLSGLGSLVNADIIGNTVDYAPASGIMVGNYGSPGYTNVTIWNNIITNPGQNTGITNLFARAGITLQGTLANITCERNQINDTYSTHRTQYRVVANSVVGTAVRIRHNQGNTADGASIPNAVSLAHPSSTIATGFQAGQSTGTINGNPGFQPGQLVLLGNGTVHSEPAMIQTVTGNSVTLTAPCVYSHAVTEGFLAVAAQDTVGTGGIAAGSAQLPLTAPSKFRENDTIVIGAGAAAEAITINSIANGTATLSRGVTSTHSAGDPITESGRPPILGDAWEDTNGNRLGYISNAGQIIGLTLDASQLTGSAVRLNTANKFTFGPLLVMTSPGAIGGTLQNFAVMGFGAGTWAGAVGDFAGSALGTGLGSVASAAFVGNIWDHQQQILGSQGQIVGTVSRSTLSAAGAATFAASVTTPVLYSNATGTLLGRVLSALGGSLTVQDPTSAPAATPTATGSGGFSTQSGDFVWVGYTKAQTLSVTPTAPTAALGGGGSLGIGANRFYAITWYQGASPTAPTTETTIGAASSVLVPTSGNQTVNLTSIPLAPGIATGRKIYVSADGVNWLYLDALQNNTAITYTDAGTLTPAGSPPVSNTFPTKGETIVSPLRLVTFTGANQGVQFAAITPSTQGATPATIRYYISQLNNTVVTYTGIETTVSGGTAALTVVNVAGNGTTSPPASNQTTSAGTLPTIVFTAGSNMSRGTVTCTAAGSGTFNVSGNYCQIDFPSSWASTPFIMPSYQNSAAASRQGFVSGPSTTNFQMGINTATTAAQVIALGWMAMG